MKIEQEKLFKELTKSLETVGSLDLWELEEALKVVESFVNVTLSSKVTISTAYTATRRVILARENDIATAASEVLSH